MTIDNCLFTFLEKEMFFPDFEKKAAVCFYFWKMSAVCLYFWKCQLLVYLSEMNMGHVPTLTTLRNFQVLAAWQQLGWIIQSVSHSKHTHALKSLTNGEQTPFRAKPGFFCLDIGKLLHYDEAWKQNKGHGGCWWRPEPNFKKNLLTTKTTTITKVIVNKIIICTSVEKITSGAKSRVFFQHKWLTISIFQLVKSQQHPMAIGLNVICFYLYVDYLEYNDHMHVWKKSHACKNRKSDTSMDGGLGGCFPAASCSLWWWAEPILHTSGCQNEMVEGLHIEYYVEEPSSTPDDWHCPRKSHWLCKSQLSFPSSQCKPRWAQRLKKVLIPKSQNRGQKSQIQGQKYPR